MDFLASAPSVDDIDITDQVAINHEECSICFEPLCIKQVGYFCDNRNKRICRHYLHFECISTIINNKACPICRRAYHHVKEVSDPRVNAKKFFDDIDLDGNGKLSFEEITDGLKATLPLDFRNIECDVDKFWQKWDGDRNGHICEKEFLDTSNGPMIYINQSFKLRELRTNPPPLNRSNKELWFKYWDEDNSSSLDKGEVIRALVKTFKFQHRDDIASQIRLTLDNVWFIFDLDGSGHIEMSEFVRSDGLADTIIATIESL
jgi:Ca2+-binding EF-hand superfamily protein